MSDDELRGRFEELAQKLGTAPQKGLPAVAGFAATIIRVAICLAGCRTEQDRTRVHRIGSRVWPRAAILADHDLISGLLGGLGKPDGVIIISGTGSCVFAQKSGQSAKVGGWGHQLGDRGSGYQIALDGLRYVIQRYDYTGSLGPLGEKIFARLGFHRAEDAIEWINHASKAEVATLADEVFATKEADYIIRAGAFELADAAALAALRVGFKRTNRFEVCLAGGVFAHQPFYCKLVGEHFRKSFPRAQTTLPHDEGAMGAVMLAGKMEAWKIGNQQLTSFPPSSLPTLSTSLTEQRNPRWPNLDRMSVAALVDAMLSEDETIVTAVRAQRKQIAAAIEMIVRALKRGGRLFYVGAGTSGRLGVLDASECPPTFGVEPDSVQGIIAGGSKALTSSVEAAEDDPVAGAAALRLRGLTRRDVVCGISASGRTPFVLGALDYARKLGAKTIFLTFNPKISSLLTHRSSLIAVGTGPEIITGSTRLKAGTATKLVLNMLTTISMIRLGKVRGNLMTSVKPTNVKLRDRAVRIVMSMCRCNRSEAERKLARGGWNVEKAIH